MSWHDEADLVVVSLWRENVCAATFRLAADDVPNLIDTLVDALRQRRAPAPVRPALDEVG